jgi:hypothetical protein
LLTPELGVAADLLRGGDRSLEWLPREAAAGEVFAAERVEGGYRLTGRKAFASLSPGCGPAR